MKHSLHDKLIDNLRKAAHHNSQTMVRPEVILWPDPERQWESVVPKLQERLQELLVLGDYEPEKRRGPVIWLKCMVARTLPESAAWAPGVIPVIYLPGIAKNDLKHPEEVGLDLQPLMEYPYTGTVFAQVSGREWTIMALMENQQVGLGLKIAQDHPTKEALVKALPVIFDDAGILYPHTVDVRFLHGLMFPNEVTAILEWLCRGDLFMQSLSAAQAEVFKSICGARFGFEPDPKNILNIIAQLASQRNQWKSVWQHYANAPSKYPEILELLQSAKHVYADSKNLTGYVEESWPQVNEGREAELRAGLEEVAAISHAEGLAKLMALDEQHGARRQWVWAELGQAPLAMALPHLLSMAKICIGVYPSSSIKEMQLYYESTGFKADQAMRRALAAVRTEKDKSVVTKVIQVIYQPWLQSSAQKFQALVEKDAALFGDQSFALGDNDEFILFVDALRFELGMEFFERLGSAGYKTGITSGWSALPSLTPTAKPAISPLAGTISIKSTCNEFRPQLHSGKDLLTAAFRNAIAEAAYIVVFNATDIQPGRRHWQEIGDIDKRGHAEQAGMVRRIEELFELVQETITTAFEKGIKKIRIVTDHGWLLLPGGLPKQELNRDLTETRWGRCALIKDGANTSLLHLPWRWNAQVFIAYAPGISFFRKNEEYAHGGISIQECLTPTLVVENHQAGRSIARLKDPKWINLTCKIETLDAPDGYLADIRTRYDAPETSIVLSERKVIRGNKITLMVDEDAENKSATLVLMNEQGVILDKKPTLVGG